MSRRVLVALGGLAALLALFVVVSAWRLSIVSLDEERLAQAAKTPAALPELQAAAVPSPPPAVTDFVERPLFWWKRRPEEPEATDELPEPVKQNATAPKGLEITGIVQSGGEWIVVGQYQGQPLRLRQDDDVAGWRVSNILADSVQLTAANEELVIDIFDEIKVQSAAPKKKPRVTRQDRRRSITKNRRPATSAQQPEAGTPEENKNEP